jgi:hypothetical protein
MKPPWVTMAAWPLPAAFRVLQPSSPTAVGHDAKGTYNVSMGVVCVAINLRKTPRASLPTACRLLNWRRRPVPRCQADTRPRVVKLVFSERRRTGSRAPAFAPGSHAAQMLSPPRQKHRAHMFSPPAQSSRREGARCCRNALLEPSGRWPAERGASVTRSRSCLSSGRPSPGCPTCSSSRFAASCFYGKVISSSSVSLAAHQLQHPKKSLRHQQQQDSDADANEERGRPATSTWAVWIYVGSVSCANPTPCANYANPNYSH